MHKFIFNIFKLLSKELKRNIFDFKIWILENETHLKIFSIYL